MDEGRLANKGWVRSPIDAFILAQLEANNLKPSADTDRATFIRRATLDLARYADSSGFQNDQTRSNAWRYRDYVISAFNQDKPFDRFVKEQLAGDELYLCLFRQPEDGWRKDGDAPLGRRLYVQGDDARGIPACGSCHGETGQGRIAGDTSYPRLAGQHRRYVTKQLSEWRAGERRNSQGGIMNVIARQLSDNDIDQLAAYVAGL